MPAALPVRRRRAAVPSPLYSACRHRYSTVPSLGPRRRTTGADRPYFAASPPMVGTTCLNRHFQQTPAGMRLSHRRDRTGGATLTLTTILGVAPGILYGQHYLYYNAVYKQNFSCFTLPLNSCLPSWAGRAGQAGGRRASCISMVGTPCSSCVG